MFRSCPHFASLCIAALLCGAGCQRELKGRPAPDEQIYFPMGLAVHPTEQNIVYLMSTDWNQKYNTGWLSTIDLRPVIRDGVTRFADQDPENPVELKRVNVPALGGELAMSRDGSYLLATFRQNNTIGTFNIDQDTFFATCGDPNDKSGLNANDRRSDCDQSHLYYFTQKGVDKVFLQDEFRSPYGIRFLPKKDPTDRDELDEVVVGFLQQYRAECLISFLDIDPNNTTETVVNQQSIDMRQGIGGLTVQSTGSVATHPVTHDSKGNFTGRYVAVGSRLNQSGTTSATIFGIQRDSFDFNAQITGDDGVDDARNDAQIARVDIRSQAGGFNITDLRFSSDGTRAFATIGYAQPAAGSSDSVVMMDTTFRTRQLQLPNSETLIVQRPEYQVLDTLAIQGTPENLLFMERAGKPSLLVTATFRDNALHFVRVGPTSMDAITRLDRQTGNGPVMLAEAHFAPDEANPTDIHDYVLVTAFLNHVLAIFDVTDDNPGNWRQYELESDLPVGDRFH